MFIKPHVNTGEVLIIAPKYPLIGDGIFVFHIVTKNRGMFFFLSKH